MGRPQNRPLTLEESKVLFRLSMQTASGRVLNRIKIRHLAIGAFAVGITLGAFPKARRLIFQVLTQNLPH